MMATGVRYNRIITADPAVIGRPRSRMKGEERLLAYKKDRCPTCGGPVRVWDPEGRGVWHCTRCQF